MKYILFVLVAIFIFFLGFLTAKYFSGMNSFVFVLEESLAISSDFSQGFLPKGTTLFFVKNMSEGYSVYKVYVNINKPIDLKKSEKKWYIAPIWGIEKDVLLEYPSEMTNQILTRDD